MAKKRKLMVVYVQEHGLSSHRRGDVSTIARDPEFLRDAILAAHKQGEYPSLKRLPKALKTKPGAEAARRLRGERKKAHSYNPSWIYAWTYGPEWAPESRRVTIRAWSVL